LTRSPLGSDACGCTVLTKACGTTRREWPAAQSSPGRVVPARGGTHPRRTEKLRDTESKIPMLFYSSQLQQESTMLFPKSSRCANARSKYPLRNIIPVHGVSLLLGGRDIIALECIGIAWNIFFKYRPRKKWTRMRLL
jgi:hypothetical protein